ncbi:hypothetical protein HK104_009198 [Borealophlyctis nickersoniae]|nr:hypothetical protein HK104_009198 [Borealophlyctis nickersoniae]
MTVPTSVEKPLYGGAMSAVLPASFLDVSHIREVPDNQEVFVDENTDQSLIIELLEMADATAEEAASFHFWQLADDNDARDASNIISVEHVPASTMPHLPPNTHISLLSGQQQITKFRERDPLTRNVVHIFMCVLRLANVRTDLVISYNYPIALGPASSSAQALAESGAGMGLPETALENFREVVRSVKVHDWGLFGS